MHTRSESSAALLDVNCTALDSLALDYLYKAELVEDDASEDSETQTLNRIASRAAYRQLHQGNICNAMAIVSKYCPSVLQDQRLTFRLKRQQFIELLRQNTPAGDAAALACARDELAPLALDAYPEAYLDFKRTLLMLVQQQNGQAQQQTQQLGQLSEQQKQLRKQQYEDWTVEARHKLAEVLYHSMVQHMGCRSPQLSQLLIYLSHLFLQYTNGSHGNSRSGGIQVQQLLQAPGADVIKSLLLKGRDEGPLAPELSGRGNVERDVQALMAAVGIPRQAALDALKAAGGDVAAALAAQLMLFRLNTKQVDSLVWAYASARGLVEPYDGLVQAVPAAVGSAPVTDGPAAASAPCDMDIDTAVPSACAAAAPTAAFEVQHSSGGDNSKALKRSSISRSGTATQGSAFCSTLTAEDVSALSLNPTSASADAAAMLRSESQSPPYKVPRWRCKQTPSRFYGRVVGSAVPPTPASQQPQQHGPICTEPTNDDLLAEQIVHATQMEEQQLRWRQLQQSLKSQAVAGNSSSSGSGSTQQQEVHAAMQQLQLLAGKGCWDEVESLVEELQPGLLQERPSLKFRLKQCQFVQLVQANELPKALQLARSQLTPLADASPELLPALKSSMALLLPGPVFSTASCQVAGDNSTTVNSSIDNPSSKLLGELVPLLESRLGVEPPMLVQLLRVLLTSHKAWFKVQRCQDAFASTLGIDKLLQAETAGTLAGRSTEGGKTASESTPAGALGAETPRSQSTEAAGGAEVGGDAHMHDTGSEGEGLEFDESEVLQVMEVLELPRATALELLTEHGGDAQAVIMQVFGM